MWNSSASFGFFIHNAKPHIDIHSCLFLSDVLLGIPIISRVSETGLRKHMCFFSQRILFVICCRRNILATQNEWYSLVLPGRGILTVPLHQCFMEGGDQEPPEQIHTKQIVLPSCNLLM